MTGPTIMGIDAGFAHMGVVVVQSGKIIHAETCSTERTAKKRGIRVADDDAERVQTLARFLLGIIRTYNPAGAAVEMPAGQGKGSVAVKAMGMAAATVATILEVTGLPAEWITPQDVKKAATGKKDGSKEQVAAYVRRRFDWGQRMPKTKTDMEHVCDAAGAVVAAEHGTLMRTISRMTFEKGA